LTKKTVPGRALRVPEKSFLPGLPGGPWPLVLIFFAPLFSG